MKFYKAFEYVLCVVLTKLPDGNYRVRKKDSDLEGWLVCKNPLLPGDEVLCQVGDSDINGDQMVLCVDYELHDKLRGREISRSDLDRLNAEQDIRKADYRANLQRIAKERTKGNLAE